MKDLTHGSIAGHLVTMALPTVAGMLFQTLYLFVDLYFVAGLGDASVAGVSAAGNAVLIVFTLTQVLSVGAVALISNAVGRKDKQDANMIFNQSLLMALICGLSSLIAGYLLAVPYLRAVMAEEMTVAQGRAYLFWLLPGAALQFPLAVMGSALRATGMIKPVMVVHVVTVLLKTALAPVLIAGWGTGYEMGVAGAGLATSIAVFGGVVLLAMYYKRREKYISFCLEQCRPCFSLWKRILAVGWPAGGEFLLVFVYTSITFWAISNFGPAAQAGFGIGSRIMQGIFLPAIAIAFGVAPIAGQNVGAGRLDRVGETIRIASIQTLGITLIAMLFCQWQPETMVRFFSTESEVVHAGALFLHPFSWSFVLSAVSLVCSGVFQAMGNTLPTLWSSVTRLAVYCGPMIWLTSQPGYRLERVWYLSIAATLAQTVLNILLLRKELRVRFGLTAASQPA